MSESPEKAAEETSEERADKRKVEAEPNDGAESDDENCIGPSLADAIPVKKRKVLDHEKLFLDNLPNSDCYEKSFMHRDVVTHIVVTKTEFVITASVDGHVKFWKKTEQGIEFVKHFRCHLGAICALDANTTGSFLCTATATNDKSVKIFDVINFDMINMFKLEYSPNCAVWINSAGDAIPALAVSDKDSNKIYIYDGQGTNTPLQVLDKLHSQPVVLIKFNSAFETVISIDKIGMVEYWQGVKNDFKFPSKIVSFESKLDTGLYEFAKNKTLVTSLAISNDGTKFATVSIDRKVRVFKFLTGKLIRVFDEALGRYIEKQQTSSQALPHMEFGRRMANERELEKSDFLSLSNIVFDYSGNFILYSTMVGVKMINIFTNRCVKIIGKGDNIRPLHLALFQGRAKKSTASTTFEQEASHNPQLAQSENDPTLFCSAFKKQRFYLYSRRLPSDLQEIDRDVFNEKPSKEDIISVTESQASQRLYENCVIHTTLGDIHLKLFSKECPKTTENFCTHSKNGYYNGHVFHRVIKGFMIQTGDPTGEYMRRLRGLVGLNLTLFSLSGTGTGGQSIWGQDFKDEFVPSLKHDRPYTLSMANAGPNTNGSQFFITILPTPWLDGKHTVFGRAYKGMEVCQNISNAKTNPKTDKPYEDIKIISINLS
jgi:peptidylprolyl isomerase domain and WD repeat-containing protein 1